MLQQLSKYLHCDSPNWVFNDFFFFCRWLFRFFHSSLQFHRIISVRCFLLARIIFASVLASTIVPLNFLSPSVSFCCCFCSLCSAGFLFFLSHWMHWIHPIWCSTVNWISTFLASFSLAFAIELQVLHNVQHNETLMHVEQSYIQILHKRGKSESKVKRIVKCSNSNTVPVVYNTTVANPMSQKYTENCRTKKRWSGNRISTILSYLCRNISQNQNIEANR